MLDTISKIFQLVLMNWLVLASAVVSGQSASKIDSLKVVIANHNGVEKIDALIELVRDYWNTQNDYVNALIYARQAQKLSFDIGDSVRIVKTSRIKGQVFSKIERIDEALLELSYALPIARRHNYSTEVMYLTNLIGMNLTLKAKYDKALVLLQESFALRVQKNDKEAINIVLNNIGVLFYKMKSYNKAFQYFQESMRIKEEIQDFYDYDNALINSGMCQVYLGNYAEASYLLNRGLDFCGNSCTLAVKSSGYYGLGVLYFLQNDLLNANESFIKSYNYSVKGNSSRFQADNLVYLGKISFELGKKQEGVNQLIESEKISQKYEYNELLITVFEELIKMFKSLNNLAQLSIYQTRLIELRAKVYSSEMIENLSKIEADYRERENLARIEHQKKMIALNEQIIERQRHTTGSTAVLLFLFLLLVLVLYRNNRFRLKINRLLEQKVQERSLELKCSIEELYRTYQEQHRKIIEAHMEVSICAASVKEMCCQLLIISPDENSRECLLRMNATTNHMLTEANREIEDDNLIFREKPQVGL